jgi:PAS domain S-box-containing protein
MFTADQNAYSIKRLENTNSILSDFVFSKPVNIGGLDWGVIELGISDDEYNSLMISYLGNVFLFALILIAIALLILHGSLKTFSRQLARLRETALDLSGGDLSARAPTEAAGEIRLLATTLNSMAESLEAEARRAQKLVRLVEDTNDAIAIFDPDGEITFVNPSLMNMAGGTLEQYRGMLLHELLDHLGIDRDSQREVIVGMSHIENGNWSVDMAISPTSNASMQMSLKIEEFYSEGGEKSGFFMVLRDNSHGKAAGS